MTETFKCDGCGKALSPAKQDQQRHDVTYLGAGDPPVSRGGPTLHFHSAACANLGKFTDWENPGLPPKGGK